jgi:hypothetical protein
MKRSALKTAWLGCCLLVLVAALYLFDGKPNSDADLVLAYGMLALAMPISIVLAATAALLGQLLHAQSGYVLEVSYASIVVTWLIFSVAGYWQWFMLLPWLVAKVQARRAQRVA